MRIPFPHTLSPEHDHEAPESPERQFRPGHRIPPLPFLVMAAIAHAVAVHTIVRVARARRERGRAAVA
jgi:hypothetical protein